MCIKNMFIKVDNIQDFKPNYVEKFYNKELRYHPITEDRSGKIWYIDRWIKDPTYLNPGQKRATKISELLTDNQFDNESFINEKAAMRCIEGILEKFINDIDYDLYILAKNPRRQIEHFISSEHIKKIETKRKVYVISILDNDGSRCLSFINNDGYKDVLHGNNQEKIKNISQLLVTNPYTDGLRFLKLKSAKSFIYFIYASFENDMKYKLQPLKIEVTEVYETVKSSYAHITKNDKLLCQLN